MFAYASAFNGDISGCDDVVSGTKSVSVLQYNMFYYCICKFMNGLIFLFLSLQNLFQRNMFHIAFAFNGSNQ